MSARDGSWRIAIVDLVEHESTCRVANRAAGACDCDRDERIAEAQNLLAGAWLEGHAAGRDYQGDGWNSDAHDPNEDNPYLTTPDESMTP